LTTAVIVQARMGSTRLPGKVMMPLGNRTVLGQVLSRCQAIKSADRVCLATSALARDDVVAEEGDRCGVTVFRGDENDVLSRYHSAARFIGADEILRVTADCPLIDPDVCDAVIKLRRSANVDYACNFSPKSFPHGLDCEAFTMDALTLANKNSVSAYEREHVTVWLIENSDITKANLSNDDPSASHHRWTLDTPDDYQFLSKVFSSFLPDGLIVNWRQLLTQIESRIPAPDRAIP
jgi:spore coat polysaccharide biosynthesis protein SpsF